jgi:hypothetical protein
MTTTRSADRRRIADFLLTFEPGTAAQLRCLCWWAILGLNQ